MSISLITTVLNEGQSLRRLLESLRAQTCPPAEIVVVDGGSSDDTLELLRAYQTHLPLKIVVEHGCNISRGRNLAISAAQHEIIAVTDAGVVLEADWLEHLTRPLREDPQIEIVSGFFVAETLTSFEVAMGATVLPLLREIDPQTFLPSSRSVAFRKSVWAGVGGYPEWLDYCEDLIFDLRLRLKGANFAFAPQAIVHFRPRGSLAAFWKQYYRYARGDGKADLWRRRHAIRYLTYLAAAPALLLLGALVHPLWWLLFVPGSVLYFGQPYRRLPEVLRRAPKLHLGAFLHVLALIPLIRVWGDVAKMVGYPVGLRWRAQRRPPDWRVV
ncbi:MAG: glycosyltransferase [Chloroflexi bacterium]|nr:glycosyltransferase [Chloroflexota bacterium]